LLSTLRNLNQVILAEGKQLMISQNKEYYSDSKSRVLAEIAIFVALSTALSFIIIFQLPQGGSITLASMVPIIWLALRRGPKIGLTAGFVYGIAGFFQKKWALAGVVVAITGRFIMHLISGALFFASYAPAGVNPWVYSGIYNGSYLLPELVISLFVIFLLQKSKALKMYM
jgi:thiamine transporter